MASGTPIFRRENAGKDGGADSSFFEDWSVKKIKAIILAAGQGTRLKKYTQDLPQGMLEFMGKTII